MAEKLNDASFQHITVQKVFQPLLDVEFLIFPLGVTSWGRLQEHLGG